MKKNGFTRSILMRDQFREDGKNIGRLRNQVEWLARRLAEAGVRPGDAPRPSAGRAETEGLVRAWLGAVDSAVGMPEGWRW